MRPPVSDRSRAADHHSDPLALLNELARISTEDLELRPMLQRLTDALARRLEVELVSLVRVDHEERRFVCEALTSRLPTEVHVGYGRPIGSGVVGHVAASGEPLRLDDVAEFANYVETMRGVRSELCLPIKHRGEVVALLNLESTRRAAFRDFEPLALAVAEQIAGAISSARLYEEIRRRAFVLEVLGEVSRAALASAELREVLSRIVHFLQQRFDLLLGAIVVANEAGTEWEHRALAMRHPQPVLRRRWPVGAGVVGRAIRTGEPQLVLEASEDPEFFALDGQVTCEYVVPLRLHGRTLGALNIETDDRATLAPENLALFRTLAEQIAGPIELAIVHRQLQAANRELAALARRDALTGVANRLQFDETLESEWRRARRSRQPLALVIVDVDHFKAYNDACGHPAGDACLAAVAETLRKSAHRAGDLVARYGGEEFAVILPGLEASRALERAEAMRRAVELCGLPHPTSPTAAVVTVSCGVAARLPQRQETARALVQEVDEALYRAKGAGRNRVEEARRS